MTLAWTPRFTRAVCRLGRRHHALPEELATALALLERDPFHAALRTHKLRGELKGCWACSAGYDCRLLFEIVKNPTTKEAEVCRVGNHGHGGPRRHDPRRVFRVLVARRPMP